MQMASRVTFWLFQWRAMGSSWSDRSRLMKPGNMVWVLSTAVGTMAHSTAMAEITGSATVSEQRPRHEISWILAMRFIKGPPCVQFLLSVAHPAASGKGR